MHDATPFAALFAAVDVPFSQVDMQLFGYEHADWWAHCRMSWQPAVVLHADTALAQSLHLAGLHEQGSNVPPSPPPPVDASWPASTLEVLLEPELEELPLLVLAALDDTALDPLDALAAALDPRLLLDAPEPSVPYEPSLLVPELVPEPPWEERPASAPSGKTEGGFGVSPVSAAHA